MRREELEELIRPLLEDGGYELVQCSVARGSRIQNIRVTLDHDNGLPIEACAKFSRTLANVLDANPSLRNSYSLEVSSPGMNRPISEERHFRRFVGERVEFDWRDPGGGIRRLEGAIGDWEADGFWLEPMTPDAGRKGGSPRGKQKKSKRGGKRPAGVPTSQVGEAGERGATGAQGSEPTAQGTARRFVRLIDIESAHVHMDPWRRRGAASGTDLARSEADEPQTAS